MHIFHEILVDLNAPISKIQISVSMSSNFVTKILLKNTSKCLPNDMFIIFFEYVVVKISVMEDYVPELKYNRNLIEFYENCIYFMNLVDLNAPTSKIQISASTSPNFVKKILLKSTSKWLSNDMFIIFFGYVVVKISTSKDYFRNMKWDQK